ncbi:MAG: hypothetical protein ACKO5Q_09610, partial [Microcystaceae cyanobacterium]
AEAKRNSWQNSKNNEIAKPRTIPHCPNWKPLPPPRYRSQNQPLNPPILNLTLPPSGNTMNP